MTHDQPPSEPPCPRRTGGAMQGLGELKAAVMDVLWHAEEPRSVRDVLQGINRDRTLAYTTIMTVLDNLHRKD